MMFGVKTKAEGFHEFFKSVLLLFLAKHLPEYTSGSL
jgi:hypothetical protein